MNLIIDKKKLRIICFALFIVYIILIVYFLIFSDMFGRGSGYNERRYNLRPFQEILRFIKYGDQLDGQSVFLNIYGNIIAFVPFGMLIRWARNKRTTLLQATIYSFVFTLAIEIVQYITKLGVFDVDDIILNTFGGVTGYLIYYIMLVLYRRYHAEK